MKKFAVKMLVVLAVPVGLAMAEAAKEGSKAAGKEEKPVARHGAIGHLFATKLGFTSEQTEKFQKIYEKHLEMMRAENERFEAEVNTILTPEQQTKFKEMTANREKRMKGPEAGAKRGGGLEQAVQQLNLPAEKLAQVQAIIKESREKMTTAPRGDRAARMQMHKDMMEKIKGVLTAEEMAKLQQYMKESHPGRPFPGRGK